MKVIIMNGFTFIDAHFSKMLEKEKYILCAINVFYILNYATFKCRNGTIFLIQVKKHSKQ